MLTDLEVGALTFQGSYLSTQGKTLPCFNLPKDLTMTLCAGYSTPLRHRIVTRWMELEQVTAPTVPPRQASPTRSCGARLC